MPKRKKFAKVVRENLFLNKKGQDSAQGNVIIKYAGHLYI